MYFERKIADGLILIWYDFPLSNDKEFLHEGTYADAERDEKLLARYW